jgi:hypothetical protein
MATIHALFKDRAFEPERLHQMGEAFDLVKCAMPGADADDIATVIIEAAQRGIADTATLTVKALASLAEAQPQRATR